MLTDFLNWLLNGIFDFLHPFFGLLPAMPQELSIDNLIGVGNVVTVLQWVNYFIPFNMAATIISVWTVAMFAYIVTKLTLTYGRTVLG